VVGVLVQRHHLQLRIARGLDVFELTPSGFISPNEIAAAKFCDSTISTRRPAEADVAGDFVVARAYVDQLERSGGSRPSG